MRICALNTHRLRTRYARICALDSVTFLAMRTMRDVAITEMRTEMRKCALTQLCYFSQGFSVRIGAYWCAKSAHLSDTNG